MSDTFQPKCFECGELLGLYYNEFIDALKDKGTEFSANNDIRMELYGATGNIFIGDILDKMDITNECCRIPFITHMTKTDIINFIKGRR